MAKNKKTAWELNIGVTFGSVNFGKKTCGLPIHIDRDKIPLERADELFCDRRLSGSIIVGHTEDDPTQLDLMEVAHRVDGVFDVKGVNLSTDHYKVKATFGKAEVDAGELAVFAGQSGRLIVTSSAEIPEPEKKPSGPAAQQQFDDEADEDEDFAEDDLESANA